MSAPLAGFSGVSLPLAIAAGAAIGALGRHYVGLFMTRLLGASFPWGTLTVNVLGAFLMGGLVAFFAHKGGMPPEVRGFLVVGLLGSFTTFSAFSMEATMLYERGAYMATGGYVLGSVGLSIAGFALGLAALRTVAG